MTNHAVQFTKCEIARVEATLIAGGLTRQQQRATRDRLEGLRERLQREQVRHGEEKKE